MATFVFGQALGRIRSYVDNVIAGTPSTSRIIGVALVGTETQANLEDLDTLALVLANGNTAEALNTNYARAVVTAGNLSSTMNDTDNRWEGDQADILYSNVADHANDPWTHYLFGYSAVHGTDTDADIVPLTHHDLTIDPDGNPFSILIADFIRCASA